MLGGSMRAGRSGARLIAIAAAGLLLVAGCDSGTGGEPDKPAASESEKSEGRKQGEKSPEPVEAAGGKPVKPPPASEAEARRLIGKVIAEPHEFGPGVERGEPYESDPDTWPVLSDDCIWQQQQLPDTVLATLTRRFVVPAGDGKGPMQLSAVVTVHSDVKSAEWEMASSMEEGMRCPVQRLSATETLTDLMSQVFGGDEYAGSTSDDNLGEQGTYVSEATGDRGFPYSWQQKRFDYVTFAVTGRAAGKGRTEDELSEFMVQAMAVMAVRLESELLEGK